MATARWNGMEIEPERGTHLFIPYCILPVEDAWRRVETGRLGK